MNLPLEQVSPFSSGSQYCDWLDANCDRCQKAAPPDSCDFACEIEAALSRAAVGDGTVSPEIARRMGALEHRPPRQKGFSYCWRCGEFLPREQP